jgi:hypothetical protein
MNHLHRKVIGFGLVFAALIAGAYALLGIGFAAIVAVGLFILGAIVVVGAVVFEEETRQPLWSDASKPASDHGYHPPR